MGEYITSVDSEQRGYSPPLFRYAIYLCHSAFPFSLLPSSLRLGSGRHGAGFKVWCVLEVASAGFVRKVF
ncbi:hypothetical protein C1O51_03980 [Akkermansia muciniphila]|nr:hypothetical protein [Akkermansia muciniphila]QAA52421.1 hypothetical protein C1O50_03975 [Akkermansia muciniphila]QAA54733.1 hypothetical protein C1O51_03980 [Akkermansia muciniphila]QAA57044.1 hypothetical protein C1O54_03950 [Akkermansia muciniphila]